jgi:hypothetical protein
MQLFISKGRELSMLCLGLAGCTCNGSLFPCAWLQIIALRSLPVGVCCATCSESLHIVGLAISACQFTSSSSPSCTANSNAAQNHSTSAILSTCLAMFCTSATFTATAFPSLFPACHVLCTTHIPSLAFLTHLPLPPQIPMCFPDCIVPISAHLLS